MSEQIVTTQIPKGRTNQSAVYCQILIKDGRKLRINIKCDSYEPQSYARISVWVDDAWSRIHNIPGDEMRSAGSYQSHVDAGTFATDRAELLRVAAAIV